MERDTAALEQSYSAWGAVRLERPGWRSKLEERGPTGLPTYFREKGLTMNSFQQKSLMLASSLTMLLALGACDRADVRTAGEKADATTARATEESKDAAARARAQSKSAADETRAMGAGASAKVDDATITTQVKTGLAADKDLAAIQIDVDTKNGVVTLTGPAPSADARERATDIAKDVKGVSSVNNKLTVKAG
jgi:hyperosmotically inducible periplasmic protein